MGISLQRIGETWWRIFFDQSGIRDTVLVGGREARYLKPGGWTSILSLRTSSEKERRMGLLAFWGKYYVAAHTTLYPEDRQEG